MITLTSGNLLESSAEALVNTVNTVGIMGKGIALQFKKAFPDNFREYEAACKAGVVRVGAMFITAPNRLHGPRYLINFPTKRHWKGKSRIQDIEEGLKALTKDVQRLRIRSIAIPPLGCGLGGLPWPDVKSMIEAAFANLPGVQVFLYQPVGAPAAAAMPNRTTRPEMTKGRAAFLGILGRYCELLFEPCLSLLEVQKLCYFMQIAGEPLRLNYYKSFYGPYADNLRHVLNLLEGHYIVGWGDASNSPLTKIALLPGAFDEAMFYLDSCSDSKLRFERVACLAEGYESAYGMELLATVHWLATKEYAGDTCNAEEILEGVRSWTSRKSKLFKLQHIAIALKHLQSGCWLSSQTS